MTTRLALLLSAVLFGAPALARAESIWTAVASEKIRPGTSARSDVDVHLAAAKNEFEAFQVVVTGAASGVSARASDLRGPGTIGGVKLFREELINLRYASSADGGTGRYPDALVPDVDDVVGEKRNAFPFDVAAGESRAIWVEIHVPADAAAGTYQGEVVVHTSNGDTHVPVTLTVWDFALPSTSSLKSSFGLAYGTLLAGHGISTSDLGALRARYGQMGLDHRISISGILDDGNRAWDHIDATYGPLLDGKAPTQLAGAKLTSVKYVGDPLNTAAMGDWVQHFKGRGWFDQLFQYTCDEPPLTCRWSDIPARAAAARKADPNLRTLVTTTIQEADQNSVTSSIDLIVPVINFMDNKDGQEFAGSQAGKYGSYLQPGDKKELWLYQSCMSQGCGGTVNMGSPSATDLYYTGWPTYMIDATSVRARALEWLSFLNGATGELYYETTMAYLHDAWSNQWDFSGNGDGTLFYPGTPSRIGGSTHIPVASIRLKMIREGMEDFEYLKALADAGDPAMAKQVASQLFPNAYTTDASPKDLMSAREAIARRILELNGKSVPPAGVSGGDPAAFSSGHSATGGCGSSSGVTAGLLAFVFPALTLRRRRR